MGRKNAFKMWAWNIKGKDHYKDVDIDGRTHKNGA
jgi:hypothetical protein